MSTKFYYGQQDYITQLNLMDDNYNLFKGSWYGPLVADPTLDPIGNAPSVGDAYFNTVANTLKLFNGTSWQASDLNTAALASTAGAGMIGNSTSGGTSGSTVQAALDTITSNVSSNTSAITGKEPTIAAGTTSQYWRGDKTWGTFLTDVLGSVLAGLSTSTSSAVVATDTVLVGVGKLQAQVSLKEPAITSAANSTYFRGDKTFQDFATQVRSAVLTGLSLVTNIAITSADTVLSALGKLQAQVTSLFSVTGTSQSIVFRNAIINGMHTYWQRGTSFSLTGTGSASGYTADRWLCSANAGTTGSGTVTLGVSQQAFALGQTAVPNNPSYFLRAQLSAAGTQGGTGSFVRVQQKIEGVKSLSGKSVTLSFWAKADSSRTYCVFLNQVFGTGGSPSSSVATAGQTISVTTSWQQFTLNFTLASVSGKTLGSNNNDYLSLDFLSYKQDNTLYSGDTLGTIGAYSTSAILDLNQVQLEAGTVATPFELRELGGIELDMCQRYFENSGARTGQAGAHHAWAVSSFILSGCITKFSATKYKTPTITLYSANSGAAGNVSEYNVGGTFVADRATNAVYVGTCSFGTQGTGTATTSSQQMYHWQADAEL